MQKGELIPYLYAYNEWSTGLLLDSMERLSVPQYVAPGCSAHGSIRDTFAHFLAAQKGWFGWFAGEMTIAEAMRAIHEVAQPTGAAIDTIAAARAQWEIIRTATTRFLESIPPNGYGEIRRWDLPNGASGGAPLWKLLLHVANHGTHTRAQVVAAMRNLGVEPPSTDLLRMVFTETLPEVSD